MKICENCGVEHDGTYGSGRFCSIKCKSSFNAKKIKHHVCNFKNKKYGNWKCSTCHKIFDTRRNMYAHVKKEHPIEPGSAWNKGLTKETDKRIQRYCEKLREEYKNGNVNVWCKGKHLSEEMKHKISESMKIAHKEGRAHNIGESRWNNEPSYPEKWFIKVIENEFEDKNYNRKYPFHGFSLDFAWVEKKKCIEIDGDQHQRFEEYKIRDERKNKKLTEEGWKYLRLIWKDVFTNPKEYIRIAKEFIDN